VQATILAAPPSSGSYQRTDGPAHAG
jgi:hypothetical protein